MKSQRLVIALLAVIAVGIVAIAGVLVVGAINRDHSSAWYDAKAEASESADSICSLDDDLDLTDPNPKCVEEKAAELLEAWEDENPDRVWK